MKTIKMMLPAIKQWRVRFLIPNYLAFNIYTSVLLYPVGWIHRCLIGYEFCLVKPKNWRSLRWRLADWQIISRWQNNRNLKVYFEK